MKIIKTIKFIIILLTTIIFLNGCNTPHFWSGLFDWVYTKKNVKDAVNTIEFNMIDSIWIRLGYLNNKVKINDFSNRKFKYGDEFTFFDYTELKFTKTEINSNKIILELFLKKIKSFVNDTNNYKFKDTNHIPYNSTNKLFLPIYSKENIIFSKYLNTDFYYYNRILLRFNFHDETFNYSLYLEIKEKYIDFTAIVNTHNVSYSEVYFYRDLFEEEFYKFLYDFLIIKLQKQELFDFEKKQQLESLNFENYIPPEYLEKFRK